MLELINSVNKMLPQRAQSVTDKRSIL